MIDGISKIIGFQYIIEIVPDNKYGSYNKETKTWDGLVKHLLDRVSANKQTILIFNLIFTIIQKADLAVCDLTITYERRTAVDFTMPFMTVGKKIHFYFFFNNLNSF